MIDADLQDSYENPEDVIRSIGARTWIVRSYSLPKEYFRNTRKSGPTELRNLGALVWYSDHTHIGGGKKKKIMNVEEMIVKWVELTVGMCTAHTKDEEDRWEASVEECLSPLLTAPVRQIREFGPKLLEALKKDRRVPYLAWRGYELWVEKIINKAPDEGIIELKTALAKEISEIIESDVKEQIPEAVARALQWRDPERLEEMKEVVKKEKEKGNKVRLRGRESCLFVEAGGTEDSPEVCVQL